MRGDYLSRPTVWLCCAAESRAIVQRSYGGVRDCSCEPGEGVFVNKSLSASLSRTTMYRGQSCGREWINNTNAWIITIIIIYFCVSYAYHIINIKWTHIFKKYCLLLYSNCLYFEFIFYDSETFQFCCQANSWHTVFGALIWDYYFINVKFKRHYTNIRSLINLTLRLMSILFIFKTYHFG